MAMIDMFVIMMYIYITSTKASGAHIAYRKKKFKSKVEDDVFGPMHKSLEIHESKENALKQPHEK